MASTETAMKEGKRRKKKSKAAETSAVEEGKVRKKGLKKSLKKGTSTPASKSSKKTGSAERQQVAGPAATEAPAAAAAPAAVGRPGKGGKAGGRGKGAGRGFKEPFADGPSKGKGKGKGSGPGRGFANGAPGRGFKNPPAGQSAQAGGQKEHRRPIADVLDYLKECARSLEGGVVSPEEESMLASRALEELGDRLLLVAADQRGSKVLEKVLRKAGTEAFTTTFGPLLEAVEDLAPNQYASHVLESALFSWADRLGPREATEPAASAPEPPPMAPVVDTCKRLCEDEAWNGLVDNTCASHVVRAFLLMLGGYAPDLQGKGRAAARAGVLPDRKFEVPTDIAACRRSVASALIGLMREDSELCLSANGSPVVQLLLRVLRDHGEWALLSEACAAIVGSATPAAAPSTARCEAMLRSAPGSRALEAVIETANAEAFSALFKHFLQPRLTGLCSGAEGEFGPFLVQRLADACRDAEQVEMVLKSMDFKPLLGADAKNAQHVIVIKVLEACLRFRSGLSAAAGRVFAALGVDAEDKFPRAWPAVLLLDSAAEEPAALLMPEKRRGKGGGKGDDEGDDAAGRASADSGAASGAMVLKHLPAGGPQLMATLLRFPPEDVPALNGGVPKMLHSRDVLKALAVETRTAKVLEAALGTSSAVHSKLRLRLARAFKGLLKELGPHHVGGWVVAAVWKASFGETGLRSQFAKELLSVEESLRVNNFALWKVCGLNQAKKGDWTEQQQKAGKTKSLFSDLLDSRNNTEEAAKAAALRRERAAADEAARGAETGAARAAAGRSDPMLAALLSADPGAPGSGDEACPGASGRRAATQAEEAATAAEIDGLFSAGRKRRRCDAESALTKATDTAAPPEGAACSAGEAGARAEPADEDLAAALRLIAGGAQPRGKRRKADGDGPEPGNKKKKKKTNFMR